MKSIIILLSIVALALGYTDLDDNVNFDKMVADRENFRKLIGCFLGNTLCPPELAPYRDHTLEAINDGCNECNEIESHDLKVFLEAVKTYPEEFEELKAKYDKDGSRVEAALKKLKNA